MQMTDEIVTMTKQAMDSMKFDIWRQGIQMASEHITMAASHASYNDLGQEIEALAKSIRAIKPPAEYVKTEPDNPYYWMWKEHQAHVKDADRKLLAAARRALDIFKCISSKSLI